MTGSSLILWNALVDPKVHILKDSGQTIVFWQSFCGFLIKLLSCEMVESERGDLSGCLAKCWEKARGSQVCPGYKDPQCVKGLNIVHINITYNI